MVDYVTELAREGALSELLYADDLVLMSGTIEGLRNKFIKLIAFESKRLTLENQGDGQLRHYKRWLVKIKVDPCGTCSLRAKANLALCVYCHK